MCSEQHMNSMSKDALNMQWSIFKINPCWRKDAQAAQDTQKFVYEEAARLEKSLLGVIESAGVKVNTADKGAFIAASKGIYDQFASEVSTGGALIEKVSSLAN